MTDLVAAPHAAAWALSRGISAMTTEELGKIIGVPPQQVRQRLQAPSRRGEWVAPGRGLWLPVPPEYRTWGAPPGIEVIQHLAAHLEVDYYVGWLSAAELLGAAHQAPQVFQVAVARQIPDRQVGRTLFQFHHRTRVGLVPTVDHVTRSGAALVSTVAVTTLDVATDVAVVGGIDNAATVLVELSEHPAFDLGAVIALAHHYPAATLRRLGWVLEHLGETRDLSVLAQSARSGAPTPARLDPTSRLMGTLDRRWNVRVNRMVEPDL